MIFELQRIVTDKMDDEQYTKETIIVTTEPQTAWNTLKKELNSKEASEIVLRYWYNTGKLRSAYAISLKKWSAWLWEGESTPTILLGILDSLMECK